MQQLSQAILDKCRRGSDLWNSCDGNFWNARARQGITNKFITFTFITENTDEVFAWDRRLETAIVQFDLFSKNSSTDDVYAMYAALTKVFDRGTVLFRNNDYTTIEVSRDISYLTKEADNYWHYIVEYNFLLQPVTTTTAP